MTKAFVDELIHHMKLATIVTKASPWGVEGFGEKSLNKRYVGIAIKNDWLDIFSEKNNLLVKFLYSRQEAYIEFYLANNTPFIKITKMNFSTSDKWETLLGELKRTLKKDKADYQHHTDSIGNLYTRIQPHLK